MIKKVKFNQMKNRMAINNPNNSNADQKMLTTDKKKIFKMIN